ncbi:MAG: hypothetical protein F4Y37_07275 [Caldilineaceae bacterium SB0664_bin_22]|nr:hypothetical protein [Caldilineaceae bacterium SB0664_bin_22]
MSTSRVPIRQITHGPKHHWFGYYDKLQFSPDGRYVLGMSVDFENRKPTARDEVRIGMVDLGDGDRWLDLGHSVSWGWQQGCMLQWRPGSAAEVMWNDRDGDHFVTRSLNIDTGSRRTWPWPFYALSPDGRYGVGVDFERIQDMRPGYGYPGVPDRNADCLRPADSGAWFLDWERDTRSMVISIEQAASVPADHPSHVVGKHYFNHLLFSPDGSRFIFLNRWRDVSTGVATGDLHTRMFTVGVDGSGLHLVDDSGSMSHFIWRDPDHILGWTRHPSHSAAFYLFRDRSDWVEVQGRSSMRVNGHCTYLPGWHVVLNDTYPLDNRIQELYLYDADRDRRTELGAFPSPPEYDGEWRVDLHPRSNRDGTRVCIDSAHGGQGRQMYLLDIDSLLD